MVQLNFGSQSENSDLKQQNQSVSLNLEPAADQTTLESDCKLIEAVLGKQQHIICRIPKKDSILSGFAGEICDKSGTILMYVKVEAFRTGEKVENDVETVVFTDASENVLFTSREKDTIAVRGAGGSHFGYIKKKDGLASGRPTEIHGLASTPIKIEDVQNFYFDSDGFTIANGTHKFRRGYMDVTTLSFASSLDVATKAMLIAATYHLNVVTTATCCSGWCLFRFCVVSIPVSIAILITLLVVYGVFCKTVGEENCGQRNGTLINITWEPPQSPQRGME